MINGRVHITIFGLQYRVSSLTHGFGPTVEIQEIPFKIRIVSSLHEYFNRNFLRDECV